MNLSHSFLLDLCNKSQLVHGHVNDFSGLHISDGIMWYLIPSRPWPAFSTLTMCLLASAYLCSEALEKDNGVSSKFVVLYSQCCEF